MLIQAWHGAAASDRAVAAGHTTVVSPTEHCYFDYNVSVTDLRAAHSFCPKRRDGNRVKEGSGTIIGGEFNLWTERMITPEDVDCMAWPRALATAEVLWAGGGEFQHPLRTGLAKTTTISDNLRRWETFESFVTRARLQYPLLWSLGIRKGPSFPPEFTDDGIPLAAESVSVAFPHCTIATSLPSLGLHHIQYAVDGCADTFFQSSRALRSGDVVEVHFRQQPLEGCVVVRTRTGRNGLGMLQNGVLQVLLRQMSSSSMQIRSESGQHESNQVSSVEVNYLISISS